MAGGATLTVRILADISDFEKNLPKADRAFLKLADSLTATGKKLTIGVTAPFIALSAALAKSAAEDAASVAKLQRTFGSSAQAMESWITQLMKTVPATDDELRGLAVSTDTLLRSMGLAAPSAMRMTQAVTKLAGDLAAYSHTELNVAQDALEKALAGKTKGLQQFGIVISEQDIKNRAYTSGIARYGEELTHAQAAQAAWALILDKSKMQQGEAARTIGDAANAMKVLRQSADSAADSFGAVVLPTAAKVVGVISDMLRGLADLPPAIKSAVVAMGALAAGAGPALIVLGQLTRAITILRAAAMSVGAGSALAGLGTILTGLGPLLLLAGGLAAAFAYTLHNQAEAARQAAADTALYTATIDKLSIAQLKQQSQATRSAIDALAQQKAVLLAQLPGAPDNPDLGNVAGSKTRIRNDIKAIDAQMTALKPGMDAIAARFVAISTAADGAGGEAKTFADQLKPIEDRAQSVLQSIEQQKNGWKGVVPLGNEFVNAMDRLGKLLDKIPDKLDPVAVKIRDILLSLQKTVDSVGGLTNLPGVQYTPAANPKIVVTPDDVVNSTPYGRSRIVGPSGLFQMPGDQNKQGVTDMTAKLDDINEATKEGFANVAIAIGDTLAQNLSALLGGRGIGAQVGGSIGGAFGSGFASYFTSKTATSALGMAGNAVIPIVGGIAGTLIGGLVGGLFGHHKDSVDRSAASLNNLANTAQKVSESISNLAQGFKIAYDRYLAADAVTVGGGSGGGGGGTSNPGTGGSNGPTDGGDSGTTDGANGNRVSIGHLHVSLPGVSNAADFMRSLGQIAEQTAARGGASGIEVAFA